MQLHLINGNRLNTKGHKVFWRVVSPRGYRIADYSTENEAVAREVFERFKHIGGDCRVQKMYVWEA